jgi:hypothetical protein
MAGAFGYERGDHYDVSIKAGERVLLPAVREAPDDTLIITNGFSCREQIVQTTDRGALHLAQVIQMAKHEGALPARPFPERARKRSSQRSQKATMILAGLGVAAGAALGWCAAKGGGKG